MKKLRPHLLRAVALAFAAAPLMGTLDLIRVVRLREYQAALAKNKRAAPLALAMRERAMQRRAHFLDVLQGSEEL